jgi:hypothetical protein
MSERATGLMVIAGGARGVTCRLFKCSAPLEGCK